MEKSGCGVLVYLQKPAPRLENEVRGLAGQAPRRPAIERGAIGLPKDLREYGIGAQILLDCGVRKLKLISNSPGRLLGIQGYGLEVVEQIGIPARDEAKQGE
jgi:3,4-dihydroxy 2-butanone 4-phosphate synthase/GTP cyclohydrolase II